jgi:hypothetical protein
MARTLLGDVRAIPDCVLGPPARGCTDQAWLMGPDRVCGSPIRPAGGVGTGFASISI